LSVTPTYLSATTFSLAGDQTSILQPKRRIRTVNSVGVVYSTIMTSAFSAGVTTVRVVNDSNTLDAGLSTLSYGLLSATNPSIPPIDSEWLLFPGAPTYVSATSFTVTGDQTSTLQIGRRIKSVNTGGTVYSFITNSSHSAGTTTVTVVNDSGTLDSGLSSVSHGLLAAVSPSLPGFLSLQSATGYQKLPSGVIIQWGASSGSAGAATAVSLPVTFPTAIRSVLITPAVAGQAVFATTESQTTSSFSFSVWNTAGSRVALGAFWTAIGY
jgi:hypothetical protein